MDNQYSPYYKKPEENPKKTKRKPRGNKRKPEENPKKTRRKPEKTRENQKPKEKKTAAPPTQANTKKNIYRHRSTGPIWRCRLQASVSSEPVAASHHTRTAAYTTPPAPLPKNESESERAHLAAHPNYSARVPTPRPTAHATGAAG